MVQPLTLLIRDNKALLNYMYHHHNTVHTTTYTTVAKHNTQHKVATPLLG